MHKYFKAIILVAVAAICLFSFTASAEQPAQQSIRFSVFCKSVEDIRTAVAAGADFVSVSSNINLNEAASALSGSKTALIVDTDSVEQADEKYSAIVPDSNVYFRINDGASSVLKWADGKNVNLIGYYKGNIYPIALSVISKYSKQGDGAIVQMQTNNQDGVILHNTVTSFFDKKCVEGMFSFADSTRSAKRTDSARSWDDLVARGYTVIETAYPADFAAYLTSNNSERQKLEASVKTALTTSTEGCSPNRITDYTSALESSVKAALATSTQGCSPNRVADYTSALEAAQALLSDGSSATYAMADARTVLDEAVENITIQDGSQLKGDLKFTPARIAWAVFGVALVLSWQIFFRKRWAKKA